MDIIMGHPFRKTVTVGVWLLFLMLQFSQWTGLQKKQIHTGNTVCGDRKQLLKGVKHLGS